MGCPDWRALTLGVALVLAPTAPTALTGCHLIFPFAVTAPSGDGGADSLPIEDAAADSVRADGPDARVDGPDARVVDASVQHDRDVVPDKKAWPKDAAKAPTWREMTVTGFSWSSVGTPRIWGVSPTEIYLSTGSVIHQCKDVSTAASSELSCLLFNFPPAASTILDLGGAGGEVYAVGKPNLVMVKSKGWKNLLNDPFKSYEMNSVWCTAATDCVLAAERLDSPYGHTTGTWNGVAFSPISLQKPEALAGVWKAPGGLWVVVGAGCLIGQYPPAWIWSFSYPTGCTADLKAVWGQGTNVFAVGDNGTSVHYDGYNWVPKGTLSFTLNAVWGTAPSNVYVVGSGGKVFWYDGTGYKVVTGPFGTAELSDLWGTSKDLIYIVGPDKVFRFGS